jgi:streptomycin 3"-adenylyltransferase
MSERALAGPVQGVLVTPERPSGTGVLLLAGSSGRVDVQRARLLAGHGALVLAMRWFGGHGQPPGICEVPLESFQRALDVLTHQGADRLGILGLSKGAEAALLVAVRDARVDAVVGIAPSSVVWPNVGPGVDGQSHPLRSSWTWGNAPLPFVPYDEGWSPSEPGPIAWRPMYESSLQRFPAAAALATIEVERTRADLVLIAGGADAVWPSELFARQLAARRAETGRPVRVVVEPDAGHRPILPGEDAPTDDAAATMLRGGSPDADRALGRAAWPAIKDVLGLCDATRCPRISPANRPRDRAMAETGAVDQTQKITRLVLRVLGPEVIGAYLHGSSVLGGLKPASDVDVLVVSRRRMNDEERRLLLEGLFSISGSRNRARPVELTVVVQSEVRPWRFPPVGDFLYGEWLRDEFEASGPPQPTPMPDLALLVTMVLAGDHALTGPPPAQVLDPVPRADLVRATVAGIPGLLQDLEDDTRNVLLTFARIWTTLATGQLKSKDAAADWALAQLPPGHRSVLRHAKELYLNSQYSEESWSDELMAQVRPHADHVLAEINRLQR